MRDGPDITRIAAMIGDPTREAMLSALLSGKALTAKELAAEAGVTAPTASGHLAQLSDAGLLAVRAQGRHRYYTLAGADVAATLESLAGLAAAKGHLRTRTGPRDAAMKEARVCYDHLAGAIAVRIFDALATGDYLAVDTRALTLTERGAPLMEELGIDIPALARGRRPLCLICLDWSERRSHLSGALGAALLTRFIELGWMRRAAEGRQVTITPTGRRGVERAFQAKAASVVSPIGVY